MSEPSAKEEKKEDESSKEKAEAEAKAKKEEQEKAEEERKKVPLKQGDYRVQVHIIEARELQGRDAGAMADPVCVVTCMTQKHQTRIHKQCLSTMFDEVFMFEFKNVYPAELERAIITASVYDARAVRKDVMIGLFQFDATTVYYSNHHEVYRQWVALTDVTDKHEGIQGYLKLSASVLGPGDEQYIHPPEDEDDEDGGMLAVMMPPSIEQKGRLLKLQVYDAKDLPRMDEAAFGGDCDPYLRVDYAGLITKTKHYKGLNVSMNQELQIPVMEPIMSTAISVSMWDWDQSSPDDRISCFRMDYKKIATEGLPPTWFCMYGAPPLNDSKAGELMNQGYTEGSHYRGRVLLSATVYDDKEPKQDVAEIGAIDISRRPPEENFVVQLDVYEGSEIPDGGVLSKLGGVKSPIAGTLKTKVKLEVCLGSNVQESTTVSVENGRAKWYCVCKDLVSNCPKDIKQVPDVFVYLVVEKKRVSYKRFTMESLVKAGWRVPPSWHLFTECKALDKLDDDEFPGTVLFSIRAGPSKEAPATPFPESRPLKHGLPIEAPPPSASSSSSSMLSVKEDEEEELDLAPRTISKAGDLTVDVIEATNLPAMDKGGTSDPYVRIKVGEVKFTTKVIKKSLAPKWNQQFTWKSIGIENLLVVKVFDEDTIKDEQMGEVRIDLRAQNLEAKVPMGKDFVRETTFLINTKYPTASVRLRIAFKYMASDESVVLEKKIAEKKMKKTKSFFNQVKTVVTGTPDPTSGSPELGSPSFSQYQLRVHLFMARNLPALDSNGLSDPYCVFRLAGKKLKSGKKKSTLNPHWFTSHVENVQLPVPLALAPDIQCMIYDWDQMGKDDSIGRFSVTCLEAQSMNPSVTQLEPRWFQINSWQGTPIPDSKILCSFQLLSSDQVMEVGSTVPSILPKTTPMYVEIVTLGLRNIQSTLGVNKAYLDFELPNGKRFGTKPSQLPEAKNPNFLQTLKIPIDIPIERIFAPTLNLEIRDTLFGGLVKRLIGATSLDLGGFMESDGQGGWRPITKKLALVSEAELQEAARTGAEKQVASAKQAKEGALKKAIEEEKQRAVTEEAKRAAEDEAEAAAAAAAEEKATEEALLKRRGSRLAKSSSKANIEMSKKGSKTDIPLVTAGDSDGLDERKEDEDDDHKTKEKEESASLLADSGNKSKVKDEFKHEGGVKVDISDPEVKDDGGEDEPFYLKGRAKVDDELEDNMEIEPFNKLGMFTGQKNAGKLGSKYRQVGLFKGLIRLTKDKDAEPEIDTTELLVPKELYVRLYILRGYGLAAKDSDGKSDPYLIIKLGKEKYSTRDRYLKNTLDPGFYEAFEIPCTIPGASQLEITVMDWDGIGDDLIGKTVIDVEDRWFTKEWRGMGLKPLERRTLHNPVSSAPQGKLELWMEIMDPLEAKKTPMVDIKPPAPFPFELRVIVWGVKNCPIKDTVTNQNDLYVTCHCSVPGLKRQDTDIHLRSKGGKGNFNWRMKFPLALPIKPWPRLRFQIWDKDFFSASDSICEQVISLKGLCKKALKAKDRVRIFEKGKDRISLKGMKHPMFPKDKPATCELSIELIPEDICKQLPAGLGRSDPNTNPFLPPPEGRVNWSLFHPLDMLKELLGEGLYRKFMCGCCCILFLGLIIAMAPMVFSNVIANVFTRG